MLGDDRVRREHARRCASSARRRPRVRPSRSAAMQRHADGRIADPVEPHEQNAHALTRGGAVAVRALRCRRCRAARRARAARPRAGRAPTSRGRRTAAARTAARARARARRLSRVRAGRELHSRGRHLAHEARRHARLFDRFVERVLERFRRRRLDVPEVRVPRERAPHAVRRAAARRARCLPSRTGRRPRRSRRPRAATRARTETLHVTKNAREKFAGVGSGPVRGDGDVEDRAGDRERNTVGVVRGARARRGSAAARRRRRRRTRSRRRSRARSRRCAPCRGSARARTRTRAPCRRATSGVASLEPLSTTTSSNSRRVHLRAQRGQRPVEQRRPVLGRDHDREVHGGYRFEKRLRHPFRGAGVVARRARAAPRRSRAHQRARRASARPPTRATCEGSSVPRDLDVELLAGVDVRLREVFEALGDRDAPPRA